MTQSFMPIAALALLGSTIVALADCPDIPGAADQPDGTWLFLTTEGWRDVGKLKSVFADGATRRVSFAYIANDRKGGLSRRGVVVIKSGLDGKGSTQGGPDQVTLERQALRNSDKIDKCEIYPAFTSPKFVSGRSYDDYHDRGYKTNDDAVLDSFHIKYASRTGCRWSNDASADAYFAGRWTSNRSQFSFDPQIVAKGQPSQFLAAIFGVSAAYAGKQLAKRRVEIKPYHADETGFACVSFQLTLSPGSFVRVNDLERGQKVRASELSWQWPD
ncbi:hypothetical protein EN866_33745 [Mesorhizobium sp. M2D.F.Ca.ET.223.01.1.1]|uniref:hypothetical protein n=1 Tax=Mesorhizobium sp. M2D.F.Ca.ET.223.01.1.1 TaxID=2563940 RepID=UPI001091FEB2|nr:hypothetical protein [Mesorhizobium sp. M2D.F.Ca.ET.223.01.1.1]TGR83837.1 hypothetical protein EN866_33745 [Mesorhizobium sp. M2D.F.Ca.ET.223.01.1.1]TGT78417.1 hypothetical protein EN802_01885 [bacterium M00.F.Ca.ET.159.01.1.1]TGT89084.1 hypothetical protein EN800_01885 [bacterium M00.F.Ca.ET.157.01.1.1]